MLARLTASRYRPTAHRVRTTVGGESISLPFFFDPAWNARVDPLPLTDTWAVPDDRRQRWDAIDLATVGGDYGEWLSAKVSRVFPQLTRNVTRP